MDNPTIRLAAKGKFIAERAIQKMAVVIIAQLTIIGSMVTSIASACVANAEKLKMRKVPNTSVVKSS